MMSEWKMIKAKDFILFNPTESIKKGATAKKVAMEQIRPFTKRISAFDYAPFNGGAKYRNGDTLMARITPCLENGKTAFVDVLDDGEIGYGSTEFIVLRERHGISDKDYVYYLTISPTFRNTAIRSMVGSSGRQRVQQSVLDEMDLFVPPVYIQKEIGKTLAQIDAKIALNNQINYHLEQIAQAIFKSWFVDFEPWGGVMPEEWQKGKISDLGEVIGGSTPSKAKPEYFTEHGVAWITPKDLSVNRNKFVAHGTEDITEVGLRNSSARLMPRGTVLFSSRAPIGYIAIAKNELCTNQGFKSIVPNMKSGTAFTYFFLLENLDVIKSMASGSTFMEVSGATMKNVPAIIPNVSTLHRFQEECSSIFEMQELLEDENTYLQEIRDTLLPRLLSGELSVSDLSNIS